MKKFLISSLVIFFVISCETVSDFYGPLIPPEKFGYNVTRLKENEEPKIIFSNDFDNDTYNILSTHYQCLGFSNFNGSQEDITNELITHCKKIGATIALYSKNYTDTRYGSTQYGLYSVKRYDYHVSYFVEFTDDVKLGIELVDLDNRDSELYKRNTGAKVFIVYKESPAYFANIVRGDIIIKINEKDILTAKDGIIIMKSLRKGDDIKIDIIRDGQIKIFQLKY